MELRDSEVSLTSRADSPYTDLESNYGCGDSISNDGWNQPSIERCMSCISKLGRSYSLTSGVKTKVFVPKSCSLFHGTSQALKRSVYENFTITFSAPKTNF